jgi:hypothetical protein
LARAAPGVALAGLMLLPALLAALVAVPAGCPEPLLVRGNLVWYRGTFRAPDEIPSPTVCEAAGGEVVVMRRRKDGVETYVCGVERILEGPEVEQALRSEDPVLAVARRLVPPCPLRGEMEARAEGPDGARTLRVTCIARIAPKDWCVDRRAAPGSHGRGCFRRSCPRGTDDVAFRGSAGACIACPAGTTDVRETVALDPGVFDLAASLPFVPPADVTWLCRAAADTPCRASHP